MSTLQALQPSPTSPTHFSPFASAALGKPRPCIRVAGVSFDDVTMPEAVERIAQMARNTDHARHVCTGNLDHLTMLESDSAFRAAYDSADLVLADGMPVVWLSRLDKTQPPLRERVAGSDLFFELGALSARTDLRLFFLGGAPGAASRAAAVLRKKYPDVCVADTYCPDFATFGTPEEEARITERVQSARPHILLVGLGAPKQEKWILANKDRLGVPLSVGVGGSFEMAAGMVKRAPVWMQKTGLEWCHRMMQEPGRLTKRYMGRDLPFLLKLLWRTARPVRQSRAMYESGRVNL
ncbi:MAG: WecB/TagA/CpsF family glycosyltransferase [Armatimonadetes bacterium]|nr:WecB/TagA/CpsF family glycosyltransferase [Armatimonadota bacterium]